MSRRAYGNDPSAGSPTETLLRLLLPLNDPARVFFRRPKGWLPASVRPGREARSSVGGPGPEGASPTSLLDHSSEIATGGVYKGQGRSRCSLMNCAYGGFLVRGKHFQSPVPFMNGFDEITHSSRSREELAVPPIVAIPRGSVGNVESWQRRRAARRHRFEPWLGQCLVTGRYLYNFNSDLHHVTQLHELTTW